MIDLASAISSADAFHLAQSSSSTIAQGSSDGLACTGSVFALREQPPLWLSDCIRRVLALSSLPENWDSYGALPVDQSSILAAQRLLLFLATISGIDERPLVAASPDGHAALSWEWDGATRNLDVDILPNGNLRYCFIDEQHPAAAREAITDDPIEIASLLTQW